MLFSEPKSAVKMRSVHTRPVEIENMPSGEVTFVATRLVYTKYHTSQISRLAYRIVHQISHTHNTPHMIHHAHRIFILGKEGVRGRLYGYNVDGRWKSV